MGFGGLGFRIYGLYREYMGTMEKTMEATI